MYKEHETHSILDSTKIKEYMSCPRKFLFKYVLGWDMSDQAHDLIYGQAVHASLEYIYGEWKKKPGYSQRTMLESMTKFMEVYRPHFGADTDDSFDPKNPTNYMRLMMQYMEEYSTDKFKVLETEIQGSQALDNAGDKQLYFVLDTVCEDSRGVFIIEHKTTKWGTYLWEQSFELSIQIGIGNMILHSLFPNAYGIIINGLIHRKTENELRRLPKPMTPKMMEVWRVYAESWYDKIQEDMNRITGREGEQDILKAFPKNETSCLQFNRLCSYCSMCQQMDNPLLEEKPREVTVGFWDPRKREKVQ